MKSIRNVVIGLALLSTYLALPVHAQTAHVIVLSTPISDVAKQLYDRKAQIDEALKDLHDAIVNVYVVKERIPDPYTKEKQKAVGDLIVISYDGNKNPGGPPMTLTDDGDWVTYEPGFENGDFEFSEDFKAIVPKPNPSLTVSGVFNLGSCVQYTPAPMGMGAITSNTSTQ